MVELGEFLNEYAANLHYFLPLVVFAALSMPVFGYFYNRLMDSLGDDEHVSLYVALGNLVTLGMGAVFSWKAALLFLILFGLDGLPMITGEFKRTEKRKKKVRVKRLPYKANGLLDEAKMAGEEARRTVGKLLRRDQQLNRDELQNIERELNTVLLRIVEIQAIQGKVK